MANNLTRTQKLHSALTRTCNHRVPPDLLGDAHREIKSSVSGPGPITPTAPTRGTYAISGFSPSDTSTSPFSPRDYHFNDATFY